MGDTWIGSQIVVRSSSSERIGESTWSQDIEQRIVRAAEIGCLDALMIWADAASEPLERIIHTCRECGLQTYLWFPVLADTYGCETSEEDLVQTAGGQRGHGWVGRWELLGSNQEEFLFICPNNEPALERIFAVYRELVESLDLDGVMLDRIRYPSCANGFETLYTCFCGSCRQALASRTSLDLEALRIRAQRFAASLASWRPGELPAWRGLEALYIEAGLEELSTFRKRSIQRVVGIFSDYARSRGLSVGLDLYSPSLAALVGQDYKLLSASCNWIKPMSYCHAVGPAGLSLELSCLSEALSTLCTGLKAADALAFLSGTLGWELPRSNTELLDSGLPEAILAGELERIDALSLCPDVRVYPGIEAVRHPGFGIDIRPATLKRYLKGLAGRAYGFIASWNLLYIPDDNLYHLARWARGSG